VPAAADVNRYRIVGAAQRKERGAARPVPAAV